jgi:iron complex outermembrane recepter protein
VSKHQPGSYSVRFAVAAALGSAAFLACSPQVYAAEEVEEELEEVQVTGSRILRRDTESNSPLVSVEAASLENRSGLNIESYLNQLPQYNPATTPTTAQFDVQITPVNSVGISSVSLRGFGPNRNLVLVDGHRSVPINALMVTDINYIPSALIERVEIISGGASAVYGADAIGGVTNFITRNNFQGAEFDLQKGIAETGDGEETRAYGLFGTNFADGRGNVTLETEYYKREASFRRNRDFYTDSYSDPTVGSPDFFVFGYNGMNSALSFNLTGNAALDALFPNRPVYPATDANGLPNPGAGLQTGFRNTGGIGIFEGWRFNRDGSIFNPGAFGAGAGNNINKFTSHGGVIDGKEYALQNVYDGTLGAVQGQVMNIIKWYNPDAYVSSPQTRHSFYASGNFDLTDSISIYSRATFANSTTKTRLFPANASFGWEASIPYNPTTDSPLNPALNYADTALLRLAIADPTNALYRNPNFIPTGAAGAQHPVSVEMSVLLNSRTNLFSGLSAASTPWILETFPKASFDDRATLNRNQVWQVEGGVKFDLPVKDWTGDVYFAHGESDTYNQATGNNSLSRWRALVSAADYGRNARLSGNQNGASVGFGAGDITCGSGFYATVFGGDARPSQDCIDAVAAQLQTNTHNTQEVAEVTFQGGVFNLPAGEVRSAVGFQYRSNTAQFTPDILQSQSSFTDQVIGVYPTGYLNAKISVKDVYGELLVPVLSDLPFLKKLELELGGRQSEYSATDSTFTYKITGNIEINDYLRFRGGYNKATRAPNLGELFLNTQEFFGTGGNFGDPCSGRSNAPYGAGGVAPDMTTNPPTEPPTQIASGQTVAGATSAYLICQAQMTATALTAFYGPSSNAAAPGPGGGFAWLLQRGNPDLKSEVADTYTAGLVVASPFENAWVSNVTATFDWYKVNINNAIQQYSTDYAAYLCYGTTLVTTPAQAAAQAATRQCQNTPRNAATGGATNALIEYSNQATIKTSGFDLGLNWVVGLSDVGFESIPGRVGMNVQASFLNYYKTKTSPAVFDVETDWKGTFGPTLAGTNGGSFDYRLFTSFSYMLDDMSFGVRWRHLPSISAATQASQDAIIKNNERVAAGGAGIRLSYTPITSVAAGAYDILDASFNWSINKTLSLRAGIDNLLNTRPKITAKSNGYPYDPAQSLAANTAALAAVCDAAAQALGCQDPTTFSLASSGAGTTNAGYYDVLGRRYFVGLKATF